METVMIKTSPVPHPARLPINIRQAMISDAAIIADFNVRLAAETEAKQLDPAVTLRGVTNLLQMPQYGFYLVATQDSKVVGSLMINYEWSDWRNGLFWWIQSVYVDADSRGQGVFRQLYQTVTTLADEQGNVCGLRLHVEHDNTTAQKTYQALGMVACSYLTYEAMRDPS